MLPVPAMDAEVEGVVVNVMVRVRVRVGWGDWVPPPLLLVQVGLNWVGDAVGEPIPLALAGAVNLAGEDRVG